MASKKNDRDADFARVKRGLDALAAIDPKAYTIAFAMCSDALDAGLDGVDPEQGMGAFLYAKAPRSLQARVDRMVTKIAPLFETFVRRGPRSGSKPFLTPRRGKTGRRRR